MTTTSLGSPESTHNSSSSSNEIVEGAPPHERLMRFGDEVGRSTPPNTLNGKHIIKASGHTLISPGSPEQQRPLQKIKGEGISPCSGPPLDGLQLTEEMVCSYLDAHPQIINKWFREKAKEEFGLSEYGLVKREDKSLVGSRTGSSSPSPDHQQRLSLNYGNSKRSNSICSWKSPKSRGRNGGTISRKVEKLSEPELFMELIRDISTELDIDTLCHKILVNVGHLTHADRASLFLAQGSKNNKYLVAKLFDVTVDSELEQALINAQEKEILLPRGVGIVGHVASTKEVINISDAYKDPRFDDSIDRQTGYKTNSVLCMPVCNFEGEVIGVAEIINKKNGTNEFTPQDVEVFQRYLTFCGIGIQNAQLFDMSMKEYKRNQMLLQLARGIFEEQTSLERLVTKIMTDSRELFKCERCSVYLLESRQEKSSYEEKSSKMSQLGESKKDSFADSKDQQSFDAEEYLETLDTSQGELPSPKKILRLKSHPDVSFYTAFELRCPKGGQEVQITKASLSKMDSPHIALAKYVCYSKETININDAHCWFGAPMEDEEGFPTYSILTIPIFNSNKVILGVAQMINKENGLLFSDYDVATFEAFATFCGLGIQNTQTYEKACRLMARQQVALECLSYHATASKEDTDALRNSQIPPAINLNLYSYDFADISYSDIDTCKCIVRMFMELDLLIKYKIPYEVMCRWTLSVKKNYRPVKYHNWRHAVTVGQTMFAMLKTGKMERFMSDLEMLGLLVACVSHDLDHRGTNNSFQTKTDSPLAILYSTSTMEHHHFDQCVMILSQDSNNIFQSLSSEDYRKVMRVVENAILSTDMGLYFKKKDSFLELSDNGEFDWQSQEKKELLCGMMMTACDVSAIAKPWEIQHKVAKLVADEFFEQGDLEKLKLNQEPMAMMDREKKDELPMMQVGFINFICLPLYKALSESFPWVKPLYDGCERNKEHWERLAEQVDMGLTWIDHEYIEKPVERNENEVISKITLNPKTSSSSSTSPSMKSPVTKNASMSIKDRKSRCSISSAIKSKNPKTTNKRIEKRLDRVADYSNDQSSSSRLKKSQSIDINEISSQENLKAPCSSSSNKTKSKVCVLL